MGTPYDDFKKKLIFPDLPYMFFPFMKFFGHGGYNFTGGGIGGGSGSSVRCFNSLLQLGAIVDPKTSKLNKYDWGKEKN